MSYTVKKVADMAGVTVRTLHHYDQIGLLTPADTSRAGYRKYSDSDIERLQEILFFRELGFDLKEIAAIMSRSGYERRRALELQKKILLEKRSRIDGLVRTIDSTLEGIREGSTMNKDNMFEAFDQAKLEEYKKEARKRWGNTEAYRESERKTSAYSKEDWVRINAISGDIYQKIAALMVSDAEPADPAVQVQVKRWYDHITDSFYTCTPEIFRGLADGYLADKRFAENIDKFGEGLTPFLSEAMKIYADSLSSS